MLKKMRQCRLNFAENRYDCEAGIIGEHYATELIVTPPVIMPSEAVYRLCFEPGGLSEIILQTTDGTFSYPLPSAVTATSCCVTLIGYVGSEQIYKSRMVRLHFSQTADGDSSIIDPRQPGIVDEVNQNTAARHGHDNKAVLDKFAESDGKPTYSGKEIGGGGGASTAEDVSYTNTQLPKVANVKTALDALVPKSHSHANKDTLDKLSVSNGKLQYNGSDVGLKGEGLDVSGATVGQIVKISAVDNSGKPAAWEPADLPDITKSENVSMPAYTNQIPISTDSNGNIFNGTGYKTGYYLSSSGAEVSDGVHIVSGFIPVTKGDIIRIKDTQFDETLTLCLYPASRPNSGDNFGKTMMAIRDGTAYGTLTVSNNEITWDTSSINYYFWENFAYLRVTVNSSSAVVTVNEEITETTTEKQVLKPNVKVKAENLDFPIPKPMLSNKKIVFFGDSIFGMTRDDTSVAAYTSKFAGATTYNVGFGGCRMSVHPSTGYAAFSMWALADAIATGNYTTQDAQVSSGADYFPQQLALLKSIDFNNVDAIIIHYGTNDFTGNVEIDNSADDDDTTTLCGALRYAIRKIKTTYPKIHIFISLPIYRMWDNIGAEAYANSQGKKLREFGLAMADVASEFNCPIIDGYKALGVDSYNNAAFSIDGTHLNDYGRQAFGEYIGGCLISAQTAADKQETIGDIHPTYYIDLAGTYPKYTCPVAMDDIKAAYNSGYNLVCRCAMGKYTATLPLFLPMPAANTWIFSGSGCLQSMGFPAQSVTVAITNNGVAAQQTGLARADGTLPNPHRLQITVGDTTYTYDGSDTVHVVIDDGTEVSY